MKKILPLILIPLMLMSCRKAETHTAFMMDTVISYDITAKDAKELFDKADNTVTQLENTLSAHIDDSEVSRINKGEDFILSDVTAEILGIALNVSENTDGAYDITVAPLVELWNITLGNDGFNPPSDEEIAALLPSVGYNGLILEGTSLSKNNSLAKIDLGGIAKGYACGKVASDMTAKGADGTVNFGGNVATVGRKDGGFRIGVKNPDAPDTLCGVITLDSGIVSVSGGYERYAEFNGVRYHHIIDPKTGKPSDSDLASAVVVVPKVDAASGALADALSTALFVMGKDRAMELYASGKYEFDAVLIGKDGGITVTEGLKERFS